MSAKYADFYARLGEIEAEARGQDAKFSRTIDVPMALLEPDSVGLRSKVEKDRDDYKELLASVKANGVLNAISVRRVGERLVIIDGLHRYTANDEAGHLFIPATYFPNVKGDDVMWLQIIGNKAKVDTRPAQYGQQLQKIFALNPMLTRQEMADRLGQSAAWVSERLKLANNLCDEAAKLVDSGKIPVSTASQLANLSHEAQVEWLDRAQSLQPTEAIPLIHQAVQRERKAKLAANKAEREAKGDKFEPIPKVRSKADLLEVMYSAQTDFKAKGITSEDLEEIDKAGNEFLFGYAEGIRYALSLDEETVNEARQKAQNEEAARAEKKAEKERKAAQEKAVVEGLDKTILGKKVEIKGLPGHEPAAATSSQANAYEPDTVAATAE